MINNKISHNLFRNLILILSVLILADVNAQKKWSLEESTVYKYKERYKRSWKSELKKSVKRMLDEI